MQALETGQTLVADADEALQLVVLASREDILLGLRTVWRGADTERSSMTLPLLSTAKTDQVLACFDIQSLMIRCCHVDSAVDGCYVSSLWEGCAYRL